ncbi:protocadherin gamma-b6 [Plakobranchus ocellatus]|uniref:Protocadherin gamma-b6 n=1 Tax=Plakobranchus ocellatus TaxID=259542 RepID=A0AAV4DTZ1_9GAST|nr:protocadherin gamma-b6 [Plakobranchus ocellatus]
MTTVMFAMLTLSSVSGQMFGKGCVSTATKNCPPILTLRMPYHETAGMVDLDENTLVNSLIGIMEVQDESTGQAGQVNCGTESQEIALTSIGSNKLYKISLSRHLDRELQSQVEVQIVCSDSADIPLSSTAIFTINVQDANDNKPRFTNDVNVVVKLSENVPVGHFVTRVSATDLDEGENAQISYYIPNEVQVEDIMRSEFDDYDYLLDPPPGFEDLYVDDDFDPLKDDLGPEYDSDDLDHSPYPDDFNITLQEALPFRIDETNGYIYTTGVIDREMTPEFHIAIAAKDNGKPPLESLTFFRVQITDVNDNKPVLLTSELHTREQLPPRTLVGQLRAMDVDDGRNAEVVFSKLKPEDIEEEDDALAPLVEGVPFIVKNNGRVLTKAKLDREEKEKYLLLVTIKDKGKPRLTSTSSVWIVVDDVNDNAPEILSPCLGDDDDEEFEHIEDGRGSRARVEEETSNPNSRGMKEAVFDDRTMAYPYNGDNEERVTPLLEGFDNSATTISTNINSMDDSNHRIKRKLRSGEIVVDWWSPLGQPPVYKVLASDMDIGMNGEVYYSISTTPIRENTDIGGGSRNAGDSHTGHADSSRVLDINSTSGEIFLRRHLLPSDALTQMVKIIARDGGNPSLSTLCILNVTFDVDVTTMTLPPTLESGVFNSSMNSTDAAGVLGPECVFRAVWVVRFSALHGQSGLSGSRRFPGQSELSGYRRCPGSLGCQVIGVVRAVRVVRFSALSGQSGLSGTRRFPGQSGLSGSRRCPGSLGCQVFGGVQVVRVVRFSALSGSSGLSGSRLIRAVRVVRFSAVCEQSGLSGSRCCPGQSELSGIGVVRAVLVVRFSALFV